MCAVVSKEKGVEEKKREIDAYDKCFYFR